MNEESLRVLRAIDTAGGLMDVNVLQQNLNFNPRIIGALCSGRTPNCVVMDNIIRLTDHGRVTLQEEAEREEDEYQGLESLFGDDEPDEPEASQSEQPEVQAPTRPGTISILDVIIDRNDKVTISCKLSDALANWMKGNGRMVNVLSDRGSAFVSNWDCNNETKMIQINLGEMEQSRAGDYIITELGINPSILKIAAAQPNKSWTVKYKGLVSKEQLIRYGEKLKTDCNRFYVNYIKPVKIHVQLTVLE